MKLIYICSGDVSVIESQVYELLKFYKKSGVDAVLLQGWRSKNEISTLETKLKPYNQYFKTVWYRSFPGYCSFHKCTKKSIRKALCEIDNYREAVIHSREENVGAMLMELKRDGLINNPILSEFRAVVSVEMKYRIKKMPFVRKLLSLMALNYFERVEYNIFNRFDSKGCAVSSVSQTINDFFMQKYPSTQMPFFWNPNVAGELFQFSKEKRREVRSKIGFNDDDVVVVCSTGGGAKWQLDYIVIPYLIKAGFKVLNLSKSQVDIPGVITMSVPFREMPALLSAADVAVLWRERTMLNSTASPSKFSEFAAMGLPVIHNKSVDVVTNYIQQTGNGFLVDEMPEIGDNIRFDVKNKMMIRSRISEEGKTSFGIDNIANNYLNIYSFLIDNNT